MKKRTPKISKKLQMFSFNKIPKAGVWVGLFAIVGVTLLLAAKAASPFVSFDAENAQSKSGVAVNGDTSASNGSYLQFKNPNQAGVVLGKATSCVFKKADPGYTQAFCDDFENHVNRGTQTGDLDSILWGVSRISSTLTPSHNACSGGGKSGDPRNDNGDPSSHYFGPITPPPLDARICNGMYVESLNDGGGVQDIDSYPKQPFDFTGRTGTVVFDVTNDGTGSHGAWPEFLITDEPVPGTRSCSSQCNGQPGGNIGTTSATNYVGFSMAGGHFVPPPNTTGVDKIFYNVNGGEIVEIPNSDFSEGAITHGCLAGHSYQCPVTKVNHYEVRISQTRIDIYGTDAFDPVKETMPPLKHLQGANIPLAFSSGLVWMNHVNYNANKAPSACSCNGVQTDHSFAWDNLGFDGPKTYRDLGYDVPLADKPTGTLDENGNARIEEGYPINTGSSKTFSLPNVTWQQTPKKAKVVLNTFAFSSLATIKVYINGHTEHAVSVKMKNLTSNLTDAMSFTFPTSDAIQGTNTITISTNDDTTIVSNISLIIVGGAPVP